MKNEIIRKQHNILGFGFVALDIVFINGNKNPIYSVGGTCGNVIGNLSLLGWDSSIITRVGNDPASKIILSDFKEIGVNSEYVIIDEKLRTPRIIERLRTNGKSSNHSFSFKCPECNSYLPRFVSPKKVDTSEKIQNIDNYDVFFFDRVTPSSLMLAEKFRDSNTIVIYEPNVRNISKEMVVAIENSNVVKFSVSKNTNQNFIKTLNEIIDDSMKKNNKLSLCIQTFGREGLKYKTRDERRWVRQASIHTKNVLDTCGAGDWCTCGFIFNLLKEVKSDQSSNDWLRDKTLIWDSLNFGQSLASLSLKYVGARGLADNINGQELLEKININLSHKRRKRNERKISHQDIGLYANSKICNTCLLPF